MFEYVYRISAGSFMVYVKIVADVKKVDNNQKELYFKVSEDIWFSYTKNPIVEGELFYPEDVKKLLEGLKVVREKIADNKGDDEEILIELQSLQFDLCYFQEDALPVAMMGWAASTFNFEMPQIEVQFDKETRKFNFEY